MLNDFQNMNLSGDSLDICDVGNFTFLKNLHSDLFACSDVAAEFDFAESALANGLPEDVLAHFPLVWKQLDLGCRLFRLLLDLVCVADRFVHSCLRLLGRLALACPLRREGVRGDNSLSIVEKVYHRPSWVVRAACHVCRRLVERGLVGDACVRLETRLSGDNADRADWV